MSSPAGTPASPRPSPTELHWAGGAEPAEASEAGLQCGWASLRLEDPSWRPWTGCLSDGQREACEELPQEPSRREEVRS